MFRANSFRDQTIFRYKILCLSRHRLSRNSIYILRTYIIISTCTKNRLVLKAIRNTVVNVVCHSLINRSTNLEISSKRIAVMIIVQKVFGYFFFSAAADAADYLLFLAFALVRDFKNVYRNYFAPSRVYNNIMCISVDFEMCFFSTRVYIADKLKICKKKKHMSLLDTVRIFCWLDTATGARARIELRL